MKKLYILFSILFLAGLHSNAQMARTAPAELFDPQSMPVAVQSDSSLFLIVSNYTLMRSVKNKFPGITKVEDIRIRQAGSQHFLSFVLQVKEQPGKYFYHNIVLFQGVKNAWYLSNQSITCGKSCQDCYGTGGSAPCNCTGNGTCENAPESLRLPGFPLESVRLLLPEK